ncbi:MAG: hypothetical protein JXA62_07765 [Candidatus Aminicenantes bacterium]|nr:hypothetical protein [Candidatus Aminicenantes bacterium]
MKKKSLWITLLLLPLVVFANEKPERWRLEAEGGLVIPGYNTVQVPNPGGTRFSLRNDLDADSRAYLRLRLSWRFARRHELSLLYAPLSLDAAGVLPADIRFADGLFPAGDSVNATYRFNSYRLTWRWHWVQKPRLDLWVGLTAKIRDAEIRLKSGNQEAFTDNVGFVPLLHLRMVWRWTGRTGLILEADAAAAKQGRAEDVVAMVFWKPGNGGTELRAGYRFVEGGADVEQVYNFAFIGYVFAGVAVHF